MKAVSTIYEIPLNHGGKKMFFLESHHARSKPQQRKRTGINATVNRKYGTIIFSIDAVEALGLDHSFIKFYYDIGSRALGFRVKKELVDGEKTGKESWRFVKRTHWGQVRCSISNILNEIQPLKDELSYRRMQIKKYKDYMSDVKEEFSYYYVTLRV